MKFVADFFPVLLFFASYFLGERNPDVSRAWAERLLSGIVQGGIIPPELAPIMLATALAIVAILAQILIMLALRKRITAAQGITFGMFIVLGSATIYFHSDTFIKWKPTVIYWLFATGLLVGQLALRRNLIRTMMEPGGLRLPDRIWDRISIAWAIFFIALGCINLIVAYYFSRDVWVSFKSFGMMGLTFVFAILQAVMISSHVIEEPAEQAAKS